MLRPQLVEGESLEGVGASREPDAASTKLEGPSMIGVTRATQSEIEAIYSMKASGVAIFERANGIMSERVWLVQGSPTASSADGLQTAPTEGLLRWVSIEDLPR